MTSGKIAIDMGQKQPYADIGGRIRWHRKLEGLNQEDYAAKAKLKRPALSNWELGSQRIGIDASLALLTTYGLSLDFIYAGNAETLPMSLRVAWRDKPDVKASK